MLPNIVEPDCFQITWALILYFPDILDHICSGKNSVGPNWFPFLCSKERPTGAGILEQSMGARNRVERNRVVEPAHQATQPGGIGSLE